MVRRGGGPVLRGYPLSCPGQRSTTLPCPGQRSTTSPRPGSEVNNPPGQGQRPTTSPLPRSKVNHLPLCPGSKVNHLPPAQGQRSTTPTAQGQWSTTTQEGKVIDLPPHPHIQALWSRRVVHIHLKCILVEIYFNTKW